MTLTNRTVAFIYAHPDDETFGCSYLIRQIADEAGNPILLTATRGDAGKTGHLDPMNEDELATLREFELEKAVGILGISTAEQLGMKDGKLDEVDADLLREKIADFLREHQADIVVTFPEDGISGHRDHIVLHHVVKGIVTSGQAPSVQKLYYNLFPPLASERPGVLRIEGRHRWEIKRQALEAHESQVFSVERVFGKLGPEVPPDHHHEFFELAWERGTSYPQKTERSIYDDLIV